MTYIIFHEIVGVVHVFVCKIVFILFYGRDWQQGVFKIMKNDYFFIFLSVFVFFPQAFGLVNECHILNLHEVIRALHLVACWIVFLLFDDWDWQGGVFKVMKNDHFFSAFSPPKLLGSLVAYIRFSWNYKSATCSCVPSCFYLFIYFYCQEWQGGVFKVMKNDHFFIFLSVLVFFTKFLGRLMSGLY